MKPKFTFAHTVVSMFILLLFLTPLALQGQSGKPQVLVDVAHGEKFWNDPATMQGKDTSLVARIKYMNGELVKNASAIGAGVSYVHNKLSAATLNKGSVLFIHIPSSTFDADEVNAVQQFIKKGGSLLLVMDSDYWSTLEQTNVNAIIAPYDIQLGGESPVAKSGGHAKAGDVIKKDLIIPFHGARTITGGTPFCFEDQTDTPFAMYAAPENGGRIVVMSEGMVSLYMTSWEGVNNYQCSEFMQNVLAWLLKKEK